MHTEYEVKILDINPQTTETKLLALGAKKIASRIMKRRVYRSDDTRWIRLRDTGERIQLAYKQIQHSGIDGTKEVELDVSDFEATHQILLIIGLHCNAYQENRRTSFLLDGVAIELDEWPLIPAYMEVEGNSVQEVKSMVKKLGFSIKHTTTMNTDDVYAHYGMNIYDYPTLNFSTKKKGI